MATHEDVKNIVSVYKIDRSLFSDDLSNLEIVGEIMSKSKDYKKEESLSNTNNNFHTSMYFAHKRISYKKWEDFFGENLGADNATFKYITSSGDREEYLGGYLSFVCFFEREDSIFALCTGKGYLVIDKYIENDFGFNLLSRLIKPESAFLRSTTANYLAGGTFENMDFFRSAESFLSQDDFGKIFREAISSLDKNALGKLGIDIKDLNKTTCLVKSSFTLKTSLSFDQIINDVLPAMVKLFDDSVNPNFQINKVKFVGKKNELLYNQLQSLLYEKIRTEFTSFDFFSPVETYLFFSADKYVVIKNTKEQSFEKGADDLTNIRNIEKVLIDNKFLDFGDQVAFNMELDDIMINAYDGQDGSVLKSSFSLKRGLHGEIEHEGEKYFWMNGKFWHIDKEFLKAFTRQVYQNMIEPSYQITEHRIPFRSYDFHTAPAEGAYNESHVGIDGFINLDKKTGLGVELCDLLYETSDTVYLTHVKIGFDRNIRDLTSQILTAARFLQEDRGKNEYLKTVYDHAGNGTPVPCSFADFCGKFQNKNVVFVFAFIHQSNVFNESVFTALGSNIAKLELFEIMKDFKKFSPPYSFKIIQLPNL